MSSTSSGAGDSEIHDRIRRLRIERNMTQKDLAKGKYSVSYISALERGTVKISPRALQWIAEQLGVSVAELQGTSTLDSPDVRWIRQQLVRHAYEQIYAQLLVFCGEIEEGLKRIHRLRSDMDMPAERSLVWFSAFGALQAGDLDEARRETEEYRRLVEVTKDARGLAALHWLRGRIAQATGNVEEAHREFYRALETDPARFGDPGTAQMIRRSLAAATRALGDLTGARLIEGDALRDYERFTNPAENLSWVRARAETAAGADDYMTACLLLRWAWNSQRDLNVHRHAAELYLRRAMDADESLPSEQREAALRRAAMLAELTGDSETRLLAGAYLAQALAERGALAVAEEVMRLVAPAAGGDDSSDDPSTEEQDVALALARGWMALAHGNEINEMDVARRLALDVDAVLDKMPDFVRTGTEHPGRALSRLFERLGDPVHALGAFRRAAGRRPSSC